MGTDALIASMQKRAAAKASGGGATRRRQRPRTHRSGPHPLGGAARCARSPATVPGPRRPPLGAEGRPVPRRPRTRAARTPGRSGAWSRAVPLNTTTAPQSGRTAHSVATADGQLAVSQPQPDVARRRWSHGAIVGERGPRSLGAGPSVLFCAVPPDDESDDDAPGFGAPLPPDDRLWRHPSELGPVAGLTDAATAPTGGPLERRGASPSSRAWSAPRSRSVSWRWRAASRARWSRSPSSRRCPSGPWPSSPRSRRRRRHHPLVRAGRSPGSRSPRPRVRPSARACMFRDDGYLVTDAHLLQAASAVQVVAGRRPSFPARSSAPTHGPRSPSSRSTPGRSRSRPSAQPPSLQVGQTAIAIGAPDG